MSDLSIYGVLVVHFRRASIGFGSGDLDFRLLMPSNDIFPVFHARCEV